MKRHAGGASPSDPGPLARTDYKIAAGFAVVFAILSAATVFVATACGSFHDDAIYLSTAKSLAEGTGYSLINLPGSPPQTKYPILYPLLLALIWKLFPSFPQNLWLMQGITLASAAAAIGLCYLYLVRFGYASRWLAFAAVSLAATTPFVHFVSTRVLSEMPFALLLVGALWRLEHAVRGRDGARTRQFVTGLILALPFLCRSIGVVLPAVALALLLLRRRPVAATAAGLAVAAGPWLYWSLTALGQWQSDNIVGYYTDYLGSWSILATDFGRITGWNLTYLFVATFDTSLAGFRTAVGILFGWHLATVFLVAGAATWLTILWRAVGLRVLPVFLVAYGVLIVLWPWPPARFLVPIFPLILAPACQLGANVVGRLLPTWHGGVLRTALAIAVVANFLLAGEFARLTQGTQFPFHGLPERTVAWRSYDEVFTWLREHTDPGDRVASMLDSMVYLYASRASFRPFQYRPDRLFYFFPGPKTGTTNELFDALVDNQAKYLTMLPSPGFAEESSFAELIAEVRRLHPDRLVPVYVGRDPRFMVFEIR
jgi:hypothetical protein